MYDWNKVGETKKRRVATILDACAAIAEASLHGCSQSFDVEVSGRIVKSWRVDSTPAGVRLVVETVAEEGL